MLWDENNDREYEDQFFMNNIIFLRRTHSFCTDEIIKRKVEFKGELYFLHEKINSCGMAIGYIVTKSFKVLKNKTVETAVF